mmetsp:Transcript_52274/g.124691  ORF Transcript_52274/g.124691 Transcript_52274/m.124691 type:complete len:450 (-) Transcript_52274:218-1567(-)|eukprot:CAMPEP_0178408098 /NCGR_PEP_ID=MMETSP0689_2-20121128/19765_1 /TAXON_ID=160604 /ORGANISM="Amphidinium massartii, Strain CS-259" /LENGTH=449 /DNA_ID=CAMNT_0020029185 /DNA_START=54 /DNA_END=1403 /DNA_ORIENTATION=-
MALSFVGPSATSYGPTPLQMSQRLAVPLQSSARMPAHQGSTRSSLRPAAAAACVTAALALSQKKRGFKHQGPRRVVATRAGALADCPYTVYGEKDIQVSKERADKVAALDPAELTMPTELAGDLDAQRKYFAENLPKIYSDLKKHGAVIIRGFELSKDADGFQLVGEALELERCEDPLHSVAARDAVKKEAGVYEAVNKPSRRKFYVGMHNEMVGNRAPGAALFVCFKAAEEGGEFLIADGRKMFRELSAEWLEKIYAREVKYSTAEFPMGFIESLPEPLQGLAEPLAYNALKLALQFKVDFDTELVWERSEYDGSKILQVRAMPQVPIVRHPYTGEPAWWGSMHSHAEFLRREREKVFGEEGFGETTGASRINKTDVYYADTGDRVPDGELKHLDDITMSSSIKVKMQEGDMVLLDNYMVMHGRCPFEGTRKHAVTWFKSPDYSKAAA